MIPGAIKLEAFGTSGLPAAPPAQYSQVQVEQAYQKGFAEGFNAANQANTEAVVTAIRALHATLDKDQERQAGLRHEAVAALTPVLEEIIEALAPVSHSKRLEDALILELQRIAETVPPVTCRITCPATLQGLIEQSAKAAGLSNWSFDDRIAADSITLSVQGGQIKFIPQKTLEHIRRVVSNIIEEPLQ